MYFPSELSGLKKKKKIYKSITDIQKYVMVKPSHFNFIKWYVLEAFIDFYEAYQITHN